MKQRTTKNCATCGKEFKLYKTTDKYCSPECVENQPAKKSVVKIKPVSDNMAKELAKYRRLRSQYLLANPDCEVRGCHRQAQDLHHRRGRLQYLCDVNYFMAVCRDHHRHIEENVIWAKEQGYSVDRLTKEI